MKNQSEHDNFSDNLPEPTSIVGIIGAILFFAAISATVVVAAKIF